MIEQNRDRVSGLGFLYRFSVRFWVCCTVYCTRLYRYILIVIVDDMILRIAIVLPANPVCNDKVCRSGDEHDKPVLVVCVLSQYV